MCGIVGYVGPRQATPIIFEGLRRLEYRGYDSAGLAVLEQNGHISIRREVGKLNALGALLAEQPVRGHIGVGHTRWATHGQPSQRNAHPHVGMTGDVVVVHNGIVENFVELREELQAEGAVFHSETDTEIIAHLVERYLSAGEGVAQAARRALKHLKGAHGIVVMSRHEPDKLVAARIGNAGGVTLGVGAGEMFIASDMPAILEHTRQMIFLESREMAVVTADGYQVSRIEDGTPLQKEVHAISWDPVSAAKGEYRHFMEKEIYEQARSVTDTIRGRADFEAGQIQLAEEIPLTPEQARALEKLIIVSCGTSAYAGLVGKFMIESLARLPVEVDYGSEFRYRDPIINGNTAVLAITQSGETVDTLAALEEGRRKGARLWSIVNVIGSQAHRIVDGAILMHAGPEIGVASTKAFSTSLVDLYMLGVHLGALRGTLDRAQQRERVRDLARLPDLVSHILDTQRGNDYEALAHAFYQREHFLFLGRGINYPIALEGALKLKEISYIHAEGYPAGEMKHGPIALIDRAMPVLAIAVRDGVYDKMISQVEQVKARGGVVIALANEGDEEIRAKADYVLAVPPAPPLLTPVLTVIPLQLLAYHLAVRRGCDVDQPRNLAKSVTVE
jgi:glucosamine--fructose-6-phosphate aminotransferase (isomerizing)